MAVIVTKLSTALVCCAVFASPQPLAAQPQAEANTHWQVGAFVDVGSSPNDDDHGVGVVHSIDPSASDVLATVR
jgi:hypothetical protein